MVEICEFDKYAIEETGMNKEDAHPCKGIDCNYCGKFTKEIDESWEGILY